MRIVSSYSILPFLKIPESFARLPNINLCLILTKRYLKQAEEALEEQGTFFALEGIIAYNGHPI